MATPPNGSSGGQSKCDQAADTFTQPLWSRFLRLTATSLFVVYICWNVFWLVQLRAPPALFLAITGLPAPTTGGTRSIQLMAKGEWLESLRCNAATIPICLLLASTLTLVGWQWLRKERLRIPGWLGWCWAATLLTAWILKLTGDREYW